MQEHLSFEQGGIAVQCGTHAYINGIYGSVVTCVHVRDLHMRHI
jgi:hypothetical protein